MALLLPNVNLLARPTLPSVVSLTNNQYNDGFKFLVSLDVSALVAVLDSTFAVAAADSSSLHY